MGLVQGLGKAEKYLRSNKTINSVYSLFDDVASKVGYMNNAGSTVAERLATVGTEASKYTRGDAIRFGMATYAAGSVAGRVASGGGVYRDSQGNFDIAGIPIL